jgi:O-antigen/teichoic acid export membrane protein
MLSKLTSSIFVRHVFVLLSGTIMAQGIVILTIPIVTRLYDPVAFSVLAGFASVLSIVTAVACLRFNVAIPLPEREDEAASLLVLSVVSATVLSVLTYGLMMWVPFRDLEVIASRGLDSYFWLLGIAIWLSGTYLAFQSWAARRKAFKRIARTKVTRAGWSVATQIGIGAINPVPLGLLLGHTVLQGFGFLSLGRYRRGARLLAVSGFLDAGSAAQRGGHQSAGADYRGARGAGRSRVPVPRDEDHGPAYDAGRPLGDPGLC